ncbi:hypothetical protein [Edaphobacter aggregans]|uniref:hypothetical protein n=1 Tax=Edaphobacter aggregans TaxID=570835 RepID=UPI0012FAD21D|nr:hypothetical protein [Edaphobacter aggregans]
MKIKNCWLQGIHFEMDKAGLGVQIRIFRSISIVEGGGELIGTLGRVFGDELKGVD